MLITMLFIFLGMLWIFYYYYFFFFCQPWIAPWSRGCTPRARPCGPAIACRRRRRWRPRSPHRRGGPRTDWWCWPGNCSTSGRIAAVAAVAAADDGDDGYYPSSSTTDRWLVLMHRHPEAFFGFLFYSTYTSSQLPVAVGIPVDDGQNETKKIKKTQKNNKKKDYSFMALDDDCNDFFFIFF